MAANNLNEYYSQKGQALPSLSERAKLYESYGLGAASSYVGSVAQNTSFLGKLVGGSAAPAPTPPSPTNSAPPKVNNTTEATNYLQNFQTQIYNNNNPLTSGFNSSDLVSALVNRGGYNQIDAENAAKGPRAADLAKEFGVGSPSGSIPTTSAPTGDEIRAAVTPSTPRPALLDRQAMLTSLRTEYKLPELETQLNDLKAAEAAIQDERVQRKSANAGKPVAVGVISGRENEIEKQEREKLDSIALQKAVVTDELNTKYAVINSFVQYAGLDYNDAVNDYESKFNENLSIYKITKDGQVDERDAAKANLTTMMNAITSGNVNYSNLPADQKLQIQKLEVQAGLPVGFISTLQMSPKDKILSFSDDKSQVLMLDGNNQMKIVQTGITPKPTGDDKKANLSSKATQILESNKNSYGHVSPAVWSQIMNAYIGDGGSKETFVSNYSQYTDPNRGDFDSAYGFSIDKR